MIPCARCGRALKRPASMQQGMGAVCYRRWLAEQGVERQQSHDRMPVLPPDPNGDIVCQRVNGAPQFNIAQLVTDHSPTGMEWGYAGSGPANFALNILVHFCDWDTAYRLHQPFKRRFVVGMPREGGRIRAADIRAWLAEQGARLRDLTA